MNNDTPTSELERHRNAMRLVVAVGEAIRGDWGTIDGRTIKVTMDDLAAYAATGTNEENYEKALTDGQMFSEDLCWRSGRGHWMDHCYADECSDEAWASRP